MSRPAARLFSRGTRSAIRASSFCAALAPAEVERGQQVGELLAVEDHALEDAVDEGLQGARWSGRASARWPASSLASLSALNCW